MKNRGITRSAPHRKVPAGHADGIVKPLERHMRAKYPAQRASRRRFLCGLVVSALTASFARVAHAIARAIEPRRLQPLGGLAFLTPAEYRFVVAAAARLVPTDSEGPGALEAETSRYIDQKLAAPGGGAGDWYMQGPFAAGKPSLGWQVALTPAELYRRSIAQMSEAAGKRYGAAFEHLSSADQDAFLTSMQKKELDSADVNASLFFDVLLNDTVEGLMADPLYGGNKDFVGWKMIGHPGMRYDWRPWLKDDGAAIDLAVVGMFGDASRYDAALRSVPAK